MLCSNCGHEQADGKFCGKCGEELVVTSTEQVEPENVEVDQTDQVEDEVAAYKEPVAPIHTNTPVNTNDSMDKVKETSKAYGNYFMTYLKHPVQIFAKREDELKNGLISIAILAVLISIGFYALLNNILGPSMDYYTDSPSFLSIFGNTLIFIILAMAIIVTLLFLINKLFGSDISYKEMTSFYGAHMVPVIALVAVAFILILLKSNTYGVLLLTISIGLILTLVPLYMISSLLTKYSKGIDPFYGYILYVVAVGITFAVFASILVDSAIGDLIDVLTYM